MFKKIAFIICTLLLTPLCANAQAANACNVLKAHEGWDDALKASTQKYHVSAGAIMAIIDQESRFKANAHNGPYLGYAQASPQTWAWFLRSSKIGAKSRSDFAASAMFVGWHFNAMHDKLGISLSNVKSQYLAYKLGVGGYMKGGNKSAHAITAKVAKRAAAFNLQLSDCGF
ncbi:MAG: transglycosylase SLT domain-containing protein [Proteobacteria bacterium]|nr:transglycosylase SLT domain-containing protein [Pseudomonadota bacterium]